MPEPIPIWIRIVVIVGAFLMAVGGIVALVKPAMLVSPTDEINAAVRTYAGYLVSRNLGIAGLLMVMLILRARRSLSTLMALTAIIQILDAIVDARESRWILVPGVLALGTLFLIGSAKLSGHASRNSDAAR